MKTLLILAAAAALTLLLSPSARRAVVQPIFNSPHGPRLPRRLQEYADRPLPPAYAGPKFITYRNGVPTS